MKRVVASGSAIASPVTAEGVILTLPLTPVPEEPGGYLWSHATVDAYINFTPGTGATQLTVRIRRGTTIGGTLIGAALVVPVVAGSPVSLTIMADDAIVQAIPPLIPGQQYVLTVQQSAGPATVAGTANYVVAHTTVS
jgi:hypothetical protein